MSRSYLLKIFFENAYSHDKLEDFFSDWCGRIQIFQIGSSSITCEMGCSSGVKPQDTMSNLHRQLNAKGFKVKKENIFCWSLHPDKKISINGDSNE